MLFGQEKVSFLNTPTPLERLPRISEELGLDFYIKRDDLTNLGVGGNKLRKLEYLLADAKRQGATTLLTMGGAQTNHGRLTAAVAAKYGMKCVIVCLDDYPGEVSANILLDRLMGAEVVLKKDDGRPAAEQYAQVVAQVKSRYEAQGEKVYEIPIGGSNTLGMLGYYECAVELTGQALAQGIPGARVVCSVDSMGTYMGLFCGLKNERSPLRLTGISIMPQEPGFEQRLWPILSRQRRPGALTARPRPTSLTCRRTTPEGVTTTPVPRCGRPFTSWPAGRPSFSTPATPARPLPA